MPETVSRLLLVGAAVLSTSSVALAHQPAQEAGREPDPLQDLDTYVERSMERWQAPGLSLVIVRGDSVDARAYGVTEVGGDVPVTRETLFGIGSLSKAFTATVIAMLVDEGRIGWDDPVVRHLPDFAMHDRYVTRHLTIRDILSHRTGLARSDLVWAPGGLDPEEVVRRLRFQKPAFGFRASYGYNNVMYLLAGQLAEKVTGQPWSELLRERIFAPLGMDRSTTGLEELRRRDGVASPHEEIGPGQLLGTVPSARVPLDAPDTIRRIDWMDLVTAPAGGVGSSAAEFGEWLRFQLGSGEVDGRRLVGEEALMETRTPQVVVPGFPRSQSESAETHLGAYGMGWGPRDYRGHLLLTHLGSVPGSSGAVALLPSEQVAVAVFVNYGQGLWLADAVVRWTVDRMLDAEPKDWSEAALTRAEERRRANAAVLEKAASERSSPTEPSLPLAAYEGTYADSLYPSARVRFTARGLRLTLGPNLSGDLDHWEDDSFRVTWDRADFGANLVTFRIRDRSRPEALRTRILGQEVEWRRRDEPPAPSDSLVGAWKLETRETIAPDGSVTSRPVWESFLLFTPEHYSMNYAGGPDSVSSYEVPFRPTEEEALARYSSLLVNAGRYTASEGILTIDPIFALVPEFVGGSGTFEYRLSGDTLVLRWTAISAADGTPDPLTAQGYSFRYRFVRTY